MWWLWCALSWAQVATVDGAPIPDSDFAVLARGRARVQRLDLRTRRSLVNDLVDERLFAMRALEVGVQNDPALRALIIREYNRRKVTDKSVADGISDEELRAWWEGSGQGSAGSFDKVRGVARQRWTEQRLAERKEQVLAELRDRAGVVVDIHFLRSFGPMPFKVKKSKLRGPIARIGELDVMELPLPPVTMPGTMPTLEPQRLADHVHEVLWLQAAMRQPLLTMPSVRRELADTWLQEELERRVPAGDASPSERRAAQREALDELRQEVRKGVMVVIDDKYLMRVPIHGTGAVGLPAPR